MHSCTPPQPTEKPKVEIENIALKIRNEFFQSDMPTSKKLAKMIERLNGKVLFLENTTRTESIEAENGKFTIFLPHGTSVVRDNFTIAHELGHYFLHLKDRVTGTCETISCNRGGSDRLEWEANWFAAELLMPKQEFGQKAKELQYNHEDLADYFGVSSAAARVRLKSLNLI
ncbi:ImmA/IrrE family metallo-endopeptidase [Desulfovibrio sp. JC022]|uniref:ImmA/IrrE family metallo-endopeptidase n=1 Tax=Desulfovibrio sp. JC022 TaxID=2593642 RepID=UPI0013D70A23|nr:ImmA/IrrE family metallo-endopeptidase [Desulfovibrio sp. JC022]NDV23235.1 ImmA/IrrE family metallo-endopeptidase [Desulfovibrio sp. JC022]